MYYNIINNIVLLYNFINNKLYFKILICIGSETPWLVLVAILLS